MLIEGIKYEDHKSFHNLPLDNRQSKFNFELKGIKKINLILGKNGSGKSRLLRDIFYIKIQLDSIVSLPNLFSFFKRVYLITY